MRCKRLRFPSSGRGLRTLQRCANCHEFWRRREGQKAPASSLISVCLRLICCLISLRVASVAARGWPRHRLPRRNAGAHSGSELEICPPGDEFGDCFRRFGGLQLNFVKLANAALKVGGQARVLVAAATRARNRPRSVRSRPTSSMPSRPRTASARPSSIRHARCPQSSRHRRKRAERAREGSALGGNDATPPEERTRSLLRPSQG